MKELFDVPRVSLRGLTPQNSVKGLHDLCVNVVDQLGKDITAYELGCCEGVSTSLLCRMFKKVVTIDAWEMAVDENDYDELTKLFLITAEQTARQRLKDCDNVEIIKSLSDKAAANILDGSIDFLYIDSAHDYENVKKEIQAWRPKIKSGGIIAGHDYKTIFGVRRAVQDAFGKPHLLYDDTSWLVYL
jgi:hypothetical protein